VFAAGRRSELPVSRTLAVIICAYQEARLSGATQLNAMESIGYERMRSELGGLVRGLISIASVVVRLLILVIKSPIGR
jgi:hypothetical protein